MGCAYFYLEKHVFVEHPNVGVVFLGMDNNFSQLLEMCSRAQYKLILVISSDNSLIHEIRSAKTEISILNIEDVHEQQPLPMASEKGYDTLVSQLPEAVPSPELLLPAESQNVIAVTSYFDNHRKEGGEVQEEPVIENYTLQMQDFSSNKFGPSVPSEDSAVYEPHLFANHPGASRETSFVACPDDQATFPDNFPNKDELLEVAPSSLAENRGIQFKLPSIYFRSKQGLPIKLLRPTD